MLGSSPPEARAILKEIAANAKADSLTLARVEHELMIVCISELDHDGAERHCRRLLAWYDDPARVPAHPLRKRDVDLLMSYAGSGMVQALLTAPLRKAERAERIQALMNEHAWLSTLRRDGEQALKQLEKMPELPTRVPLGAEAGWIAWLRWTLVVLSVAVFLALGWLFLVRRRRQA